MKQPDGASAARVSDVLRVRVDYTVTVDESYRRAIRRFYGQDGIATRAEVKRWFEAYGSSMDDDLMAYAADEED